MMNTLKEFQSIRSPQTHFIWVIIILSYEIANVQYARVRIH